MRDSIGIQSEYSQDTALVELTGYNQNTEWDTVWIQSGYKLGYNQDTGLVDQSRYNRDTGQDTIGIQSRIQSGYKFG